MIIRRVPRTEYDIKIEPCCKKIEEFLATRNLSIEDDELVVAQGLERFKMSHCMYCGAQILFADK